MHVSLIRAIAASVAIIFLPHLYTQTSSGQATKPCRVPVPPLPYTAEFKITQVQFLANGATITQESTETSARDSQNRTMQSTTQAFRGGDAIQHTYTHVNNPVDNTQINWDSRTRKATIVTFPPADQRHGSWKSDSGHMTMNYGGSRAAAPTSGTVAAAAVKAVTPQAVPRIVQPQVREDLGTTTIQGVEAKGTHWTSTTPVGAIGNDQPLVRTSETWMATGLNLVVREVSDDPQSGKRTKELVSLSQSDPDPQAFQPPEGYEVVNEEMHEVPCE